MIRVPAACLLWLLSACAEPQQDAMPPGYLDEPPAPPTSSTQILSGGTLIADTIIEDSVVVMNEGRLVAWGKRGEVDVPNDSIGLDMRGRWITQGTWEQLAAGAVPSSSPLQAHRPANLLIMRSPPPYTDIAESDLGGRVVEGRLELFGS